MSTKAPKELIGELERIGAELRRFTKCAVATKNMLVSTVNALSTIHKLADEIRKDFWDAETDKGKEIMTRAVGIVSLVDKTIVGLNKECKVLEENLIK